MKRRIALKQLGLITAGAIMLPACVKEVRKVSIALKNIAVTGDQEALLAEVVGSIIPATDDIPGARELKMHEFVLRMVDDCHDQESQQQFVTGLSQLDEVTNRQFNKTFVECSPEERLTLFGELEKKTEGDKKMEVEKMKDGRENQLPAFYAIAKRHTIRGYLSSEYIMTNVLVYNMIPGRYDGCVEIKDKNDIQTVIG